jgi:hypothetical protein
MTRDPETPAAPSVRRLRRALGVLLLAGVAATAAGGATYGAFSGVARSEGNAVTAGTVALADDDGWAPLVSLPDADAGQSASGCIRITYSGTLAAQVRVYGAATGTMAGHVDLEITRGTRPSGSFPSCTGFTPDATDYAGHGAGVVWKGRLAELPPEWASGIVDPVTWGPGDEPVFRARLTVDPSGSAQGTSSGSASITWEARNT